MRSANNSNASSALSASRGPTNFTVGLSRAAITGLTGYEPAINLSVSQKKSLALANTNLGNRSIYLFEEWAADQDPAIKRLFYTELLPDLNKLSQK